MTGPNTNDASLNVAQTRDMIPDGAYESAMLPSPATLPPVSEPTLTVTLNPDHTTEHSLWILAEIEKVLAEFRALFGHA